MPQVGTGYPQQEWRSKLRRASFRGVPFFVQQNAKRSGRRTAVHQNPKNDIPYAEDMGRRAYQVAVTGYIVGPFWFSATTTNPGSFELDRDNLEAALEDRASEGAGQLILPTRGSWSSQNGPIDGLFTCINFTTLEREIWGGYCEFEMIFHEYGQRNMANPLTTATGAEINQQATTTSQSAIDQFNQQNTQ